MALAASAAAAAVGHSIALHAVTSFRAIRFSAELLVLPLELRGQQNLKTSRNATGCIRRPGIWAEAFRRYIS